jgi:drug/metabolite transporter (DMT)-like permease
LTISPRARNRLSLVLAAFLFSTGGAAIKFSALTAWQIAGLRSAVAAAVIALWIPDARRGWNWQTLAVGVSYAATLILFVAANKLTTAANAIFLQSTAPLYLLFIGPLVLREKTRPSDIVVFAAIAAGGALVLYSSGIHARVSEARTGDLLAALSGFTWAWTIAGLRWLGKRDPEGNSAISTVVAGNAIAFAICLPFALPVAHANAADLATIIYLGVFQVGLAYVLLTRSIRKTPAFEAALLLLVEPVFNPLWSWTLYREQPPSAVIAGGAIIVAAASFRTWEQSRISGATM